MLTRSPQVPAASPNASPSSFHTTCNSSFHYAPVSPQKRPSKPPTPVSRRQPMSSPLGLNTKVSIAAASQHQPPTPPSRTQQTLRTRPPTTYVAVDAATQYSPMETHDYYASRPAYTRPSPMAEASLPTTPPTRDSASRPVHHPAPRADHSRDAPADVAATVSALGFAEEPPMLKAPQQLSPNKRRNSSGPGSVVEEEASYSAAAAQGLLKRVKPQTAPPKVLPVRYELCDVEDVVVLIANMLSELIETNDGLAMRSGHLTRFHSRTAPGISVFDYLHRLAKHATLTPPLLLSMVYYIDRLCTHYLDFTINTLTVHRFLITAATVAAKGLSDLFWNNSTYARIGGVKVAELKLLELEFLHRVDWKIVPDPDVLVAYYRGLVTRSPAYVLEDEAAAAAGETDADADDDLLEDSDEAAHQSDGAASAPGRASTSTSTIARPPAGGATMAAPAAAAA